MYTESAVESRWIFEKKFLASEIIDSAAHVTLLL